jgi:hypothetical protein
VNDIPEAGALVRVTVLRDATTAEVLEKYGLEAAGDLEGHRLRMGQTFVGVVRKADEYGFLLVAGSRLLPFGLFDPVAVTALAPAMLALAA